MQKKVLTLACAVAFLSTPLVANTLIDNTMITRGWVTQLSGASEFGLTDGGGVTCPACDSVVNFGTYANPNNGNWVDDLGLFGLVNSVGVNSEGRSGGIDSTARWVFFYQIENTNPLPVADAPIENFNVSVEAHDGAPVMGQPYSSGGYLEDRDLAGFDQSPGLDGPNDGTPSSVGARFAVAGNGGTEPTRVQGSMITGPSPMANIGVRTGAAYGGALFEFGIPGAYGQLMPGQRSDVLWLTSNARYASFVWGETESPGGFGAAGDVAGVAVPVPLPAAVWMMIAGLSCLGLAGRRRLRA